MGDSVWLISRQGHLWPWQNTAVSTVTLQFHAECRIGVIDSLPSSLRQHTASCCLRLQHCTQAVQMRESFFVKKKKNTVGKRRREGGKESLRRKGECDWREGEVLGGREGEAPAYRECLGDCTADTSGLGLASLQLQKQASYVAISLHWLRLDRKWAGSARHNGSCFWRWTGLWIDATTGRGEFTTTSTGHSQTKHMKWRRKIKASSVFTHSGHSLLFMLLAWASKS